MNLTEAARKNRDYYLSEKKTDNAINPWFRYVKTMDSYAEPILLSPEMASEILAYDEPCDLRMPLDNKNIQKVAEDLKGKSYKTLSISFSGKLLDGRLTLHAILLNKKSAIVFVSFNISDKLGFLFG